MKKFDTILWDLDQTLLDFAKSQDYSLKYAFLQYGREIGSEIVDAYDKINTAYWKRLEKGEIAKDVLLTGRFMDLFADMGITDIDAKEFWQTYQKSLGEVYYYLDDSLKLCQKLHGKVGQYIVTNGVSSVARNKLRLSGLDQFMEDIFVSEELKATKPELAYFEACFTKIPDFKKERTLIVGDSLTSDMTGGNRAGIKCCWYNPTGKINTTDLQIDYEIKHLWEVEEIL